MRIHRFFLTNEPLDLKIGDTLNPRDKKMIHQWINVFRMKEGEEIVLLDNSGFDYRAVFITLKKDKAALRILEKTISSTAPSREIVLYQSLIKKDKLEWVVQKGTELGIAKFVPIISQRSEKKNLNLDRLRIIAKEASEQSGRGKLPELHKLLKLPEALETTKGETAVFDSSGDQFSTYKLTNLQALNIFIGPEGGWSEKELSLFKARGMKIISLGKLTLRAETAAIAVSSLLLL